MTAINITLALPNTAQASAAAVALMTVGLSVDLRPNHWPATIRPVSLQVFGDVNLDVPAVLDLLGEADYEVIRRSA